MFKFEDNKCYMMPAHFGGYEYVRGNRLAVAGVVIKLVLRNPLETFTSTCSHKVHLMIEQQ
jgi:hypothetical protein